MKLNNGAVDFYEVKQQSRIMDFIPDIPFGDYIYDENLPEEYVNIEDFGADISAGYEVNTKAVNEAIAFVSGKGGGTVFVPEGTYTTSRINLKSNVRLFIKGCLKCIDHDTNKKEKNKLAFGEIHDVASRARYGYIFADGAENVTICGGGKIDGSGATYCQEAKYPELLLPLDSFHLKSYIMAFRGRIRFEKQDSGRVNLVELRNCNGVDIHNIELYETACWTCNLFQCDGIDIRDVVINSNFHVANSDGFDLSCCSNAEITHCYIATGDDGLCIKADGDKNIENIFISDCKVMSLANCFKIGTTVYRDVNNVTVKDCEFFMGGTTGGYAGISIQSDCGGNVSDITVENIRMDGVTSPFLLWLGDRRNISPGSLENVTIKNIIAKNVSLPCAITGTVHEGEDIRVKNVTLENIDVSYRDSAEKIYIRDGGVGYESMKDYPEITRVSGFYKDSHELSPYWELPVYGLFVRHINGLRVKDFRCKPRSCNNRKSDNITDEKDRIFAENIIVE